VDPIEDRSDDRIRRITDRIRDVVHELVSLVDHPVDHTREV
jgi:hypothetical protein